MSYTIFLISFLAAIYFTQRSSEGFVRASGVFFLIYQVPLVVAEYGMVYFGTSLTVSYGPLHFMFAAMLNCALVFVVLLKLPAARHELLEENKGIFWLLIVAAIVAALVDGTLNLQYLALDKTQRFAGEATKVSNLYIFEYDWLLVFIAVGITLILRGSVFFGAVIVILVSLIGLALGMRYYFVVPVLFAFSHISQRWNVLQRIGLSVGIIGLAPIFGGFLDAVKGYIIFYEWVSHDGFFAYWLGEADVSLISGEVAAIGANYWIGLNNSIGAPDFLSYVAALVPGSNRFYDASAQTEFYNGISTYLSAISTSDGQGTAFGMLLESYYTFGLPLIFFAIVKWIAAQQWPRRMQPIVVCVCFYVAINIARNGLTVALSILKVYILLFLIFFAARSLFLFCSIALNRQSASNEA